MDKLNLAILSEACERVRQQLECEQDLVREDVAELVVDHDALTGAYRRIVRTVMNKGGPEHD
jgi:hypothetical protein